MLRDTVIFAPFTTPESISRCSDVMTDERTSIASSHPRVKL